MTMASTQSISFDVDHPTGAIRFSERADASGHCHYYGKTLSGTYLWCNECKCFVNTPCDHRKRLCKNAKRYAQRNIR